MLMGVVGNAFSLKSMSPTGDDPSIRSASILLDLRVFLTLALPESPGPGTDSLPPSPSPPWPKLISPSLKMPASIPAADGLRASTSFTPPDAFALMARRGASITTAPTPSHRSTVAGVGRRGRLLLVLRCSPGLIFPESSLLLLLLQPLVLVTRGLCGLVALLRRRSRCCSGRCWNACPSWVGCVEARGRPWVLRPLRRCCCRSGLLSALLLLLTLSRWLRLAALLLPPPSQAAGVTGVLGGSPAAPLPALMLLPPSANRDSACGRPLLRPALTGGVGGGDLGCGGSGRVCAEVGQPAGIRGEVGVRGVSEGRLGVDIVRFDLTQEGREGRY